MTQLPPDCADKYRLLELLARGGYGEVWRAVEVGLDRVVALKLLISSLSPETNALERFRREARLAANLHHPNVVLESRAGFELPLGVV
jgi:serine/threonine protein kinase